MPALPSTAVATYERLRGEVLDGGGRPAGLGAIVHHGLIDGLRQLGTLGNGTPVRAVCPTAPQPIACDRELLRLLANMVLEVQSEVSHVY